MFVAPSIKLIFMWSWNLFTILVAHLRCVWWIIITETLLMQVIRIKSKNKSINFLHKNISNVYAWLLATSHIQATNLHLEVLWSRFWHDRFDLFSMFGHSCRGTGQWRISNGREVISGTGTSNDLFAGIGCVLLLQEISRSITIHTIDEIKLTCLPYCFALSANSWSRSRRKCVVASMAPALKRTVTPFVSLAAGLPVVAASAIGDVASMTWYESNWLRRVIWRNVVNSVRMAAEYGRRSLHANKRHSVD